MNAAARRESHLNMAASHLMDFLAGSTSRRTIELALYEVTSAQESDRQWVPASSVTLKVYDVVRYRLTWAYCIKDDDMLDVFGGVDLDRMEVLR